MLIKANDSNFSEILSFCQGSTLGTRILCYAECYGFDRDFAEFFICKEENDTVGILMRFDDSVTIITKNNALTDEMSTFTEMLYCNSIASDKAADFQSFSILSEKTAYIYRGECHDYCCDNVPEEKYKDMYKLISQNIPDSFCDSKGAYLSFLSDFTFRKTRSHSRAKGVFDDDGKIIACALTSAETGDFAVISGVACDKDKRRNGSGKKVVLSLADELMKENKKALVIALNDSAKGFYEHIGFTEYEKIYYFGRKN